MHRRFRPFLAVLLALILGATSLTMAVARGQTRVAGTVVICSGYGMVTVAVDANGDPAGPVHLCPDMVLGLFAAVAPPDITPVRPEGRAEALRSASLPLPVSRAAPAERARGPPVPV